MNCCLTCSQSIRASEMIIHLRNFVNFYFLKQGSKMSIIGVISLIFILSYSTSNAYCDLWGHTQSVKVLQHAYCDCTGKIEVKMKMCFALPIAANEYKVLVNSIAFNNPPQGSIADEGENLRLSPNVIDGEYVLVLENLCPGSYTITFGLVTGVQNGFPVWSFYIVPTTVQINGGGPFSVSVDVDNQPCNESSAATFTIVGGDPPFTIQRCDGSHFYKGYERTHIAEKLGEGSFCYKIKNYWGCEQTVNFNVESQNQLIDFNFSSSSIQCGEEDGTGYASISNITGTNDYTIKWRHDYNGQKGPFIDELEGETSFNQFSTGCYWVEVEDIITGCIKDARFCITWVPLPNVTAKVTDAGCDYNSKGSIVMEPHVSGNYYKWFKKNEQGEFVYLSGVHSEANGLYNLDPGEYKVCAWININCQQCTTVVIKQVEKLEAYAYSIKGEGCYNDDEDGEVIIEIFGGCKPYKITKCGTDEEYDYSTIEEGEDYQIIKIERLKAGAYCFKVNDNGCCPGIQLTEVIIDEVVDKLQIGLTTFNVKEGENCYSIAKVALLNDGHPPYFVEWLDENGEVVSSQNWNGNPPPPQQQLDEFPAEHWVRITDDLGCIREFKVIVPSCTTSVVKGVVNVYTNPSYGSLNIDLVVDDGPTPVKTKFFNSNFNEVKMTDHGIMQTGNHTVLENVSLLPPGMYYVGAYFDDMPVGQFHLIQIMP
ncbi:MAG: hypothetical protein WC313_02780 [Candidatus Kapaibacterium sp.]